jgi:spore coat polysaccharide biosynthesis predicted glycosyltransferase SpsG
VATCEALKPMRDALRREFCSAADQPLAVLAAKFNEIKGVLGDLAAAVRALPDMRLIIKPHPAETPEEYASLTDSTPNISIADAGTDLARLLTAADAIVTMNSTVAIDGLVLGLPSLVIGLPNNLSPLVDAGAMLGADGVENIRRQLHALLYDAQVRRKVTDAGAAFASRYELASDGQAARRTAEAILSRAGSPAHQGGMAEGS